MINLKEYAPNYKRSNLNLISSVINSFEGEAIYSSIDELSSEKLRGYDNVVFIILDGLGYKYLKTKAKGSFIEKKVTAKLTSVFPSSTAAAVSSMVTGVAPQQHAFTEWYIYFRELGVVMKSLPFVPLYEKSKKKRVLKQLIKSKGIFTKMNVKGYVLINKYMADSQFTKHYANGAKIVPFNGLDDMPKKIKRVVTKNKHQKFLHVYWEGLDSVCHEYGINSQQALVHYKKIDRHIKKLTSELKGTNTKIIITADHGLIDSPKAHQIKIYEYDKLISCLRAPLSGGTRVVYAHVKKNKCVAFEKYIKKNLSNKITLKKSGDLIKEEYFGIGGINKEFKNRIGDYVLICKENYSVLIRKSNKVDIGHHGGLSEWEMFVPLIELN